MKQDFKGVRMHDVGARGAETRSTLLVEQAWCDPDMVFVKMTGGDAFLNVKQVKELVRRMTAWLDGRTAAPEPTLWEDA